MLQTQVDYWKLQETKRANQAQERLKSIELELRDREISETTRHDLASEAENLRQHLRSEEQRGYEIGNATMDVNTRIKQAEIAERNADTNVRNASSNMIAAQARAAAAAAANRSAAAAEQRNIYSSVAQAQTAGSNQRKDDLKQREVEKSERMETYEKAGTIIHGAGEAGKTGTKIYEIQKKGVKK